LRQYAYIREQESLGLLSSKWVGSSACPGDPCSLGRLAALWPCMTITTWSPRAGQHAKVPRRREVTDRQHWGEFFFFCLILDRRLLGPSFLMRFWLLLHSPVKILVRKAKNSYFWEMALREKSVMAPLPLE
jgi:hypothetical protein